MAEQMILHFDDLLMRIRTFALPFVATAIGTGSALGQVTDETNVRLTWIWLVVFLSSMGLLLGLFILYVGRLWREPSKRFRVNPIEYVWLLLIAGSCLTWAGVAGSKAFDTGLFEAQEFPFTAPVLALGSMILFSIYLLDRFYYTSLLLGAVGRAENLERGLGRRVNLAHEISFATQRWTYTALPTALYLLPLAILVNVGAAVAVLSGESSGGPWV